MERGPAYALSLFPSRHCVLAAADKVCVRLGKSAFHPLNRYWPQSSVDFHDLAPAAKSSVASPISCDATPLDCDANLPKDSKPRSVVEVSRTKLPLSFGLL